MLQGLLIEQIKTLITCKSVSRHFTGFLKHCIIRVSKRIDTEGENMNYSYERVSTIKQDTKRQEINLEAYKIDKRYIDKLSGKNADRTELLKLKDKAVKGDIIYIDSISRLGRNVDDLRALVEYFVNKGVTVHFIKEGIVTNGTGYKFLITILGAVAEMERETIQANVIEGLQKAKIYGTKSGKAIGRPERKDTIPDNFKKYYEKWKAEEITAVEFSKLMGMGRTTLYRYINLWEQEGGK
jgi:DNA invertase Pin-like site-specific DNA recombinase